MDALGTLPVCQSGGLEHGGLYKGAGRQAKAARRQDVTAGRGGNAAPQAVLADTQGASRAAQETRPVGACSCEQIDGCVSLRRFGAEGAAEEHCTATIRNRTCLLMPTEKMALDFFIPDCVRG